MDILFISPRAAIELTNYCNGNLIIEVLEHFSKNAIIVAKNDDSKPSRSWIVTDYIRNDTIEYRKKVSVILSLAAIGGFVQIADRTERGDVNVLCMLKETKNISEEDFDYFIEAFYNFSHGNGVKFT